MSATKNECNRGSPSIYRPEANAWISKRSSDLDYKGVFALIKIGFLQSSFYEVMWSSLECFKGWFPWVSTFLETTADQSIYLSVYEVLPGVEGRGGGEREEGVVAGVPVPLFP